MYLHVWALASSNIFELYSSRCFHLSSWKFSNQSANTWRIFKRNKQSHWKASLSINSISVYFLYYSSTVAHRISFKSFYARCLTALLCPEDRNTCSCYIKQQLTEAGPHCKSDGLLVWNPLTLHIYNPGWECQVTQATSVLYIFHVIL